MLRATTTRSSGLDAGRLQGLRGQRARRGQVVGGQREHGRGNRVDPQQPLGGSGAQPGVDQTAPVQPPLGWIRSEAGALTSSSATSVANSRSELMTCSLASPPTWNWPIEVGHAGLLESLRRPCASRSTSSSTIITLSRSVSMASSCGLTGSQRAEDAVAGVPRVVVVRGGDQVHLPADVPHDRVGGVLVGLVPGRRDVPRDHQADLAGVGVEPVAWPSSCL